MAVVAEYLHRISQVVTTNSKGRSQQLPRWEVPGVENPRYKKLELKAGTYRCCPWNGLTIEKLINSTYESFPNFSFVLHVKIYTLCCLKTNSETLSDTFVTGQSGTACLVLVWPIYLVILWNLIQMVMRLV